MEPIKVTRSDLWTAAYQKVGGSPAGTAKKKGKQPAKRISALDLFYAVENISLCWRDEWIFELTDAYIAKYKTKMLVNRLDQVLNRIQHLDEECYRSMTTSDQFASDDEIAGLVGYGMAVLAWYRCREKGEVDALLDFTVDEAETWIAANVVAVDLEPATIQFSLF